MEADGFLWSQRTPCPLSLLISAVHRSHAWKNQYWQGQEKDLLRRFCHLRCLQTHSPSSSPQTLLPRHSYLLRPDFLLWAEPCVGNRGHGSSGSEASQTAEESEAKKQMTCSGLLSWGARGAMTCSGSLSWGARGAGYELRSSDVIPALTSGSHRACMRGQEASFSSLQKRVRLPRPPCLALLCQKPVPV